MEYGFAVVEKSNDPIDFRIKPKVKKQPKREPSPDSSVASRNSVERGSIQASAPRSSVSLETPESVINAAGGSVEEVVELMDAQSEPDSRKTQLKLMAFRRSFEW